MVAPSRIRVMISSRSNARVFDPPRKLRDVRLALQAFLRSIRWSTDAGVRTGLDEPLFDVWIHEDEAHVAADRTTYQLSLDEIARADIVIALYTGEAGSAGTGNPLGICHAEMHAAITRQPELVHVMELLPLSDSDKRLDREFRDYVGNLGLYRHQASDLQELQRIVAQILQTGTARLVHRAARFATRAVDRGAALDWRRLNLTDRQSQMRQALPDALAAQAIPGLDGLHAYVGDLAGERVLLRLDAIPGPLTMAAARELVGQPFLRDYRVADVSEKENVPGPIHVIACHRGVTELQASAMLGSPDTMVISSDFGVYASDHIHRTQLVLLKNCADARSIDIAVRHLQDWLLASGEGPAVLARAKARRKIVAAIRGAAD